jgi:hypothetical protein
MLQLRQVWRKFASFAAILAATCRFPRFAEPWRSREII